MSIVRDLYSVTVEVSDPDRALAFYRDVLGCEVRFDVEVWPGARLIEVVPPGASVPVALITRESGLPIGVRYLVADADAAHAALVAAGVQPHTEVLHLDGAPPMFTCSDPEGNTVIMMEG